VRHRGDLRHFLWLVRRYLGPYWWALGLLLLSSYLATALAGLLPVLMAPILDLALGVPVGRGGDGAGLSLKNLGAVFFRWVGVTSVDDRFHTILLLCAFYVTAGIVKSVLDFANHLLAVWIRVRATSAMRLDLFRHVLSLSLRFFTTHKTGELVSQIGTEAHRAIRALDGIVRTLLTAPILVAFYGYLLVRTSPRLVVAAAGAAVLHWVVTRGVRDPIRRLAGVETTLAADLTSRLQEAILSIRVVKSFCAELFEAKRLERLLDDGVGASVKYGVYKHVGEPARAGVNYVVEATILALAAWELLSGRLGAPAFFLFLYVGRSLLVQVGLIGEAQGQLQETLAASSGVVELLAQAPEIRDGTERIDGFHDRIVLDRVTFDYGGERVLDGVTLEIPRGRIVAVVGPSGVGKSTLVDLVLRLYDPVQGVVTIDGRDVRTLRQADYRRLFGVVSQETLLFNATIRENIAYGRPDITEARIREAATIANAHDFVAQLPQGYDTVVGDRGIRLSGGQRQRIAIARAIVDRPPILVLDEATSSLDSESERLVQQAIEAAVRGTTCLVIAHRLSTVRNADQVVVMNRGGIEAIGGHADLLMANETYRQLLGSQVGQPYVEATPRVG